MQEDATQRWYAGWSLVLWAVGLLSFVANFVLPPATPDEVYGIVFLGVILPLPAGLALGVLALRTKVQKYKGVAASGVVLNSITLVAYILLLVVGAALMAGE